MPVVASAQIALSIDAPEENTRRVLAAIRHASANNADVVVLPELSNSGYRFKSKEEAQALSTEVSGVFLRDIAQVSEETGMVVVIGFNQNDDGELYSSSAIIDNGKLLGIYRKTHLWADENLIFSAGDEPPLVVETSVGTIGTAVCYDMEFPETVRMASESGAALLAVPVNWPRNPRLSGLDFPLETVKAISAASQYQVHIAIADRTGKEREQEWEAASTIVAATGALVGTNHQLGSEPDERLVIAELDFELSKQLNQYNNALNDRRTDIYNHFDRNR